MRRDQLKMRGGRAAKDNERGHSRRIIQKVYPDRQAEGRVKDGCTERYTESDRGERLLGPVRRGR